MLKLRWRREQGDRPVRLAQLTKDALNGVWGATRYAEALATGDWADDRTIEARRAVCKGCPSRVTTAAVPGVEVSDWCGRPIHDGYGDTPPTCGCHLYAKTAVGSERCVQGKW